MTKSFHPKSDIRIPISEHLCCLVLIVSLMQGREMNFFSSEKLTGKETREDGRCKKCDAQPYLVRRILDPLTGKTIRMFECKCGSRTWSE